MDSPERSSEALTRLFSTYGRDVLAHLLSKNWRRPDAEEIVSDAFLHVWQHAGDLSSVELDAVLQAADKAAEQRSKQTPSHPDVSIHDAPEVESIYAPGGPDLEFERQEAYWVFQRALAGLGRADRRVLQMAFWEGMSTSEIAVSFGVSERRVASVLARSLRQLVGGPPPGSGIDERKPIPGAFPDAISTLYDSGPVTPNGDSLIDSTAGFEKVRGAIVKVDSLLLERLARNPGDLYSLNPAQFEELVGELFSRMGYSVERTPMSKDGGVDLWLARKEDIGSFKYVVQCKKYSPNNKVEVALVRELYGVVQATRVTAGLLVTTSSFTRGAREFQRMFAYQLELHDYLVLQEWLQRYRAVPTGVQH